MSHDPFSPSARNRWGVCARSKQEEARYPSEEGSSPAAIDGTHDHTLIELCGKANLANPLDYIGKTLKDHEGEFTVDKARALRAKVCIDYVNSLCGGETTLLFESRVNPFYLVQRLDMGGTIDIQVRRTRIVHLIDYKGGGAPVEVTENPQLLQYGCAVVSEYLATGRKLEWETARLTIVQPKLAERGLNPIQSWEVPISRLIAEAEKLKAEAAAAEDPNAAFTPGPIQCKYCRHRNNCTAKAEKVMTGFSLEGMFKSVDEPTPNPTFTNALATAPIVLDIAQQAANKNPTEMPDEQIRAILDAAPLMRQLLESVEEEALARMKAGRSIPGLKIVNGRGSRAWAFPEEEMAGKLGRMGIPKGSLYVTKLVSPAQAEKLSWTKRDGTAVQLTPRQLERMESEYVTKLAGKLTVVPESDARPAVMFDVTSLFQPIAPPAAPVAPAEPALPAWLTITTPT